MGRSSSSSMIGLKMSSTSGGVFNELFDDVSSVACSSKSRYSQSSKIVSRSTGFPLDIVRGLYCPSALSSGGLRLFFPELLLLSFQRFIGRYFSNPLSYEILDELFEPSLHDIVPVFSYSVPARISFGLRSSARDTKSILLVSTSSKGRNSRPLGFTGLR